jgi:DNA-directed RNA polymerase subunit RPC12/RpoP
MGYVMAESLHYICPTCGSDVEVGTACPGCPKVLPKRRPKQKKQRKQAAHSWQQDEIYDGLNLPDDELDDDAFKKREFGRMPHNASGLNWRWWLIALILLVLMVLGLAAVIPFWFF